VHARRAVDGDLQLADLARAEQILVRVQVGRIRDRRQPCSAARARLLDIAVDNVRAFLAGNPRNVVTP